MSAATKPTDDLVALHDVSRRHRPVSPLLSVLSASAVNGEASNEESEAEALIAIPAEALEAIAEETSDAARAGLRAMHS